MKKVLLALFVVACGTTVSAQTDLSTAKAKSAVVKSQDDQQDQQIREALNENKELQDIAIEYLNDNKKSKEAMAKVFEENKGEKAGMIKSILSNKKLSTMALDYIKDNPDLMKKVMSTVGK
jgi:hypothetical protein